MLSMLRCCSHLIVAHRSWAIAVACIVVEDETDIVTMATTSIAVVAANSGPIEVADSCPIELANIALFAVARIRSREFRVATEYLRWKSQRKL